MNSSITKITAPRVSDIVTRQRLIDLLDKAMERPVVWLSSPPGSGKTTLVASYLETRDLPCLWYQVDEGDADPATFFYYMGLAAKKANPRRKKKMPLLTPEYLAGMPEFTKRFFEELAARLRAPSVIVLDNYQDAPTDADFHGLICRGIEALPEGIALIAISRKEPPPPYARLKANRQMSFLGWNELRFTREEVRNLISTVRAEKCPEKDCPTAKALMEKTDGWAAGLTLMLQGRTQLPPRDKSAQAHCIAFENVGEVFDYFGTEVAGRTDVSNREFLMKTSFLPFMTADIAARLSGRENAGQILSGLSRDHFFTDWRPGSRPVYQYHPLFRDFLQAHAKIIYGADELAQVQRRAAELLAEAGFSGEAVELYCALGDFVCAVPLISRISWPLLAQGRSKTVEGLLRVLPGVTLEADPDLLHLAGLCRFTTDLGESRVLMDKAFHLYLEKKNYPAAVRVCGSYLEALIIEGSSYEAVDTWIDRLDDLARRHEPAPGGGEEHVAGIVLFALAFRNLNHPSLPFWLKIAETAVMLTNDTAEKLKLCNYLMAYYLFKGEFRSITPILRIVRSFRKGVDSAPVLRLLCMLLEAYHAVYVLADAEGGMAISKEAIEYGRHTGVVIYEFWFSYLMVAAAIPAGNQGLAEGSLAAMMEKGLPIPPVRFGDLMVLSGGVAMGMKDWGSAAEYYQRAIDAFSRAGAQYSEVLNSVHYSRALFELGDEKSAFDQLELASNEGWAGSGMIRYMGLVTQAFFHLRSRDREKGLEALREAFPFARSKGLLMAPFWKRDHSALVCAGALEAGIEPEFVRQIVTKHRLSPPAGPEFHTDAWPWPIKIYTLGRFEILKDGEPLRFGGKVQKKPIEALKVIISFGGREIPEELIMDALWPDADADAAMVSFKTTLHRLRQGLGGENYILLKNGRLSLSEEHCWVDVFSFQNAAKSAEADGAEGSASLAQKAVQYYQGPFLPEDSSRGWSGPMRERTRRLFIRLIGISADVFRQTGRPGEAAELYESAVESDELDEGICMALMECYSGMRRKDRVVKTYDRYCSALSARLDIGPSDVIRELFDKLVKKKK